MLNIKTVKQYAVKGIAITTLMSVTSAFAGSTECIANFRTNKAFQVGDSSDSKAIQKQAAAKPWEDFIWRGPIKLCNATTGNKCTYSWTQSKTSGYTWEAGGGIDPGKIPVVGGLLSLLSINGSYGRNKSWTESFGWSQTFDGNNYVQPVQVVQRRWIAGDFKGTFWSTGNSCSKLEWSGTAWTNYSGLKYWWEDGYRWGNWSTNAEVMRYGKYHSWKA